MEIISFDYQLYLLMGVIFFVAGIIQGLFGMGLPAIGIALLSIFLPPLQAIGLNIIPIFLVSLFQIFQSGSPFNVFLKYRIFVFASVIVGFSVSFLVVMLGDRVLMSLLAIVVILFSLNNIFISRISISNHYDRLWQLFFGVLAGVVGALTSILGVVGVLYLSMKDLRPKEFISGNGLLIFVGCLSVGTGYIISGVLQYYMVGPSLFGTVSAIIGFLLGSFLRNFLSPENFYKIIWFLFLITGFRLALTAFEKF